MDKFDRIKILYINADPILDFACESEMVLKIFFKSVLYLSRCRRPNEKLVNFNKEKDE